MLWIMKPTAGEGLLQEGNDPVIRNLKQTRKKQFYETKQSDRSLQIYHEGCNRFLPSIQVSLMY